MEPTSKEEHPTTEVGGAKSLAPPPKTRAVKTWLEGGAVVLFLCESFTKISLGCFIGISGTKVVTCQTSTEADK